MSATIFFNAHHSPVGAFASLTLGAKGSNGGFGLELDRPASCSLFIGAETSEPGRFLALPFFGEGQGPQASDFDLDSDSSSTNAHLTAFSDEDISRKLTPCLDEWKANDLTFRVFTPIRSMPEPGKGSDDLLAQVILPVIWLELTLDNTQGKSGRRVFFGQQGGDPSAGLAHAQSDGLTGIWLGRSMGFFTDQSDAVSGIGFGPSNILFPNDPTDLSCMLGACGMLVMEVPAGEVRSMRMVGAFFRDGWATTGIKTRYLYTQFHQGLEESALQGLNRFDQVVDECLRADQDLDRSDFSQDQRFMLAHALRSYHGSTQLLAREDGTPLWNVNEGEYRMMNTFDLTVDHLFYELRMNPWVQRNALDLFVSRYSYYDEIAGQKAIAFTHDMGVGNHFSRPGWSSYERRNETGCFSHMSHEELVNWVLCACVTLEKAPDPDWKQRLQPVLADCLQSLCLRDNPDPALRTGIMSIDSPRCGPNGAEITTYDSLDPSLGQSRASTYLGVKTLAAYAHLANSLEDHGQRNIAEGQALLSLSTLSSSFTEDGILPSLLEGGDRKMIIPVIEGLVYFRQTRLWSEWTQLPEFADFVGKLSRHLHIVLEQGKCLFPSGGWKLSASSSNSWLSKIYLCQYVARTCLGWNGMECFAEADRAHVDWLVHPDSLYWAWSDQMVDGVAKASKYYPRGVTSILWLEE